MELIVKIVWTDTIVILHKELHWNSTPIYNIILLKSVAVSKLQVAILARSSREMSQTVRMTESTPCHEFAS